MEAAQLYPVVSAAMVVVIAPGSGAVAGVITRHDIFKVRSLGHQAERARAGYLRTASRNGYSLQHARPVWACFPFLYPAGPTPSSIHKDPFIEADNWNDPPTNEVFMFNRVRVVSGLLSVLVLFVVLQLFTGGAFFNTVKADKENFAYNQRLATLQQAMGTSWVSLVQARNTLNRAGIRYLLDSKKAGSGATVPELVALANDELKVAGRGFADFNANLPEKGKTAENVLTLQTNYKAYRDALAELVEFLGAGNFKGFVDQPTQSLQDKFEKDYTAWQKAAW